MKTATFEPVLKKDVVPVRLWLKDKETDVILCTGKGKDMQAAQLDALPYFNAYYADEYEIDNLLEVNNVMPAIIKRFINEYGQDRIRSARKLQTRMTGVEFNSDYDYAFWLFEKYFNG